MAMKTTVFLLTLNILFLSLVCSQPLPAPTASTCPRSGFKLGACAGLFGYNGIFVGDVPTSPCCSIFFGFGNLEAAACLCTVIKTEFLGFPLEAAPSLSVFLNDCGKPVPTGFNWGVC